MTAKRAPQYWTAKDGRKLLPADMEDAHLVNAISYVLRTGRPIHADLWRDLLKEGRRRKLVTVRATMLRIEKAGRAAQQAEAETLLEQLRAAAGARRSDAARRAWATRRKRRGPTPTDAAVETLVEGRGERPRWQRPRRAIELTDDKPKGHA